VIAKINRIRVLQFPQWFSWGPVEQVYVKLGRIMKDEKLIKNQMHILAEIVRKCWVDPDFRTKFLQQPEEVFRGYHVKNAKKIQVVENTKNIMYLQLHEISLSKKQLKKISAGASYSGLETGLLSGAGGLAGGLAAGAGLRKIFIEGSGVPQPASFVGEEPTKYGTMGRGVQPGSWVAAAQDAEGVEPVSLVANVIAIVQEVIITP
jgi:hypothetical protein